MVVTLGKVTIVVATMTEAASEGQDIRLRMIYVPTKQCWDDQDLLDRS